jgi:ribosomal protein L11 methylase PrmA
MIKLTNKNKIKEIILNYKKKRDKFGKEDDELNRVDTKGLIHNCSKEEVYYEVLSTYVKSYWKYKRVGNKYKTYYYQDEKGKILIEERFEPIRFLKKYEIDKLHTYDENLKIVSIQIGDYFLLDSRLKKYISEELNNNIVYFETFFSYLSNEATSPYSALTMTALDSINFKNKNFIDFGSGFGCLSFFAKMKGANNGYCIEKDNLADAFNRQVILNDYNPKDFKYIRKDIKKIDKLDSIIPIQDVSIAIANIGDDYNSVDSKVIKLIDDDIEVIIMSGYTRNSSKHKKAIKDLRAKGFNNFKEFTLEENENTAEEFFNKFQNYYNHSDLVMEEIKRVCKIQDSPRVAFIAEKL